MKNVKPVVNVKQNVFVTGKVQFRHVLQVFIFKKAEKPTLLYSAH